jgi:hypothetical protein
LLTLTSCLFAGPCPCPDLARSDQGVAGDLAESRPGAVAGCPVLSGGLFGMGFVGQIAGPIVFRYPFLSLLFDEACEVRRPTRNAHGERCRPKQNRKKRIGESGGEVSAADCDVGTMQKGVGGFLTLAIRGDKPTSAKGRPLSCQATLICSTTQNCSELHTGRDRAVLRAPRLLRETAQREFQKPTRSRIAKPFSRNSRKSASMCSEKN